MKSEDVRFIFTAECLAQTVSHGLKCPELRNIGTAETISTQEETHDLLKLKSEANNNVSTAEVIHRQ
jgi:hypothetical protein